MYKKTKDTIIIVIVLEKVMLISEKLHSLGCRDKSLRIKVELADYRIHKKLICPKHFTNNIKRRLSNKMMYSKGIIVLGWRGN